MRGCGRIERPAFPAPSEVSDAQIYWQNSRACAADREAVLGCDGLFDRSIMTQEAHRLATLGSTPSDRDANLLRLWVVQVFVGSLIFTGAAQLHRVAERARRVARFLLKGFVLVQRQMRSRVRFHITEIA